MHSTDASPWGRGIASAERNTEEIKALGRRSDRWRFSAEEERRVLQAEATVRGDAVDVETLSLKDEWRLDLMGMRDSSEVPLNFIGNGWGKVDASPWERHEPIPILEGRCITWLLQHLARPQKNLNKKHLVLSDSMSVVLALTKGRSSSKSMNRICRQVAAVELATGMHVHLRWIPSELNPADLPSRARPISEFSLEDGLEKFRKNHAEKAGLRRSSGWRTSALHHRERWGRDEMGLWSLQRGQDHGAPAGDGTSSGGRTSGSAAAAKGQGETEFVWPGPRPDRQGQEDVPGAKISGSGPREELPEGLQGLHGVGRGQFPQPEGVGQSRQCGGQPDQPPLFRGKRPSRCHDFGGGSEVLSQRCQQGDDPPEDHECAQGIQEVGTSSRASASSMAHVVRDREESMGSSQRCGIVAPDGVGDLLPTRRSHEVAQVRPGASKSNVQASGRDPQLLSDLGNEKKVGGH